MTTYTPGNIVRSTVTFVPAEGTVALGNVTARTVDAAGAETALTVAAGATNVFTADITIPDTAISGPWVVRWESSTPKISVEVGFGVTRSGLVNP